MYKDQLVGIVARVGTNTHRVTLNTSFNRNTTAIERWGLGDICYTTVVTPDTAIGFIARGYQYHGRLAHLKNSGAHRGGWAAHCVIVLYILL
jgi:hypothetical protein